jgi:hypothetical protein
MSTTMTASDRLEPIHRLDEARVDVRIKLAALWTSMMFVFVYVDLFSMFRADVRAEIESGEIAGFTIGGTFLLAVTTYILLPSLMIYGSVALRAGWARRLNIWLAVIYAVTIVGGAVGEWGYYLLGSAVELAILAIIVRHGLRWPHQA